MSKKEHKKEMSPLGSKLFQIAAESTALSVLGVGISSKKGHQDAITEAAYRVLRESRKDE